MTSTIDVHASRDETTRLLFSNDLLASFDRDLLAELKPHFRRVNFVHGGILGEPSDAADLMFVESGVVAAFWSNDKVRFQTHLIGSEGCLNAASWLKASPSSYTYRALVECSVLKINAQKFRELTEDVSGVCRAMASYAASVQDEIAEGAAYSTRSATTRMARLILSLQDRTGPGQFVITQAEIAEALSVQRTTINQAAQNLFESKAINYTRARVKIVDRAALEKHASA